MGAVTRKPRNSSIELLRIVAMFFIVGSHYLLRYSGLMDSEIYQNSGGLIVSFNGFGHIAVIVFTIITGYFAINRTEFRFNKLLKFLLQILFYNLGLYIICVSSGIIKYTPSGLAKAFFPVCTRQYWFATCYVILFICIPFINKGLRKWGLKGHLIFGTIFYALSLILELVAGLQTLGPTCGLISFYTIGAYLRKHQDTIFDNKDWNIFIFISTFVVMILTNILIYKIRSTNTNFGLRTDMLMSKYSPLALVFATSIFCLFKGHKIYNENANKVINYMGGLMFGVYLIHKNKSFEEFLWNDIMQTHSYVHSSYLVLHMCVSVATIFIACILIELVRKVLFDTLYDKVLDKPIYKLESKLFRYEKRRSLN